MTTVNIEETPGGDQPLAKAQGDVTGFETQLAEAVAYVPHAEARLARAEAAHEDALVFVDRANAEVDRLTGELEAARERLAAVEAEGA